MKKILLILSGVYFCLHSFSQAGRLDSLFGHNGIQKTIFFKGNVLDESGKKVLQQADGKILVIFSISTEQGIVTRYLSNGTLDVSYGVGGFSQVINIGVQSAALQSDGKVVVVGNSYNGSDNDFAVARIKTNGNLDSSFGLKGVRVTDFGFYDQGNGVAIQSNGQIVVAGTVGEDFGVARYNTNGSLDLSFSTDGRQTTDFGFFEQANAVAIQNDGKIVVAGTVSAGFQSGMVDFAVARYNTNGSLDITFSGDGKQTTNFGFDDYGSAVVIQTDGKIVVAGTASESNAIGAHGNFALARYLTNGLLDNTFSGDGKQTTDLYKGDDAAAAIALQTDGKLVVGGLTTYGTNQNFGLARYNTNGSLDLTFSGDGRLQTNFGFDDVANSVMIQADGKIVLAGEIFNDSDHDFGLARYTSSGVPDVAFSGDGLVQGFFPTDVPLVYAGAALQADGKIVVVGHVQHKVSGSAGNSDFAIARYNTNGSLDSSFNTNGKLTKNYGSNDFATSVAIQLNGKIVVAGTSNKNFAVARFNANGSADSSFNGSGRVITDFGLSEFANAVVIQPDGKIVVAGGTTIDTFPSMSNFAVARYNINGSLDSSFSGDGKLTTEFGADDYVNALVIQKDGKILAVGSSQDSTLTTYFALARYNKNGTLDPTFSGDGKQVKNFLLGWQDDAKSVTLQGDGKILVAGAARDETSSSFLIARYKTDGNLDSTFSADGIATVSFMGDDEATTILQQCDGKSIIGGLSNGGFQFAIARCNLNGVLDAGFGSGGKQITDVDSAGGGINKVVLSAHRVYAVGSYKWAPTKGIVAAYQLGSFAVTLKCPSSRTVPPDSGKCVATVKGIDPVVTPTNGTFTIKYALSGATTGSGTGTASNRVFNNGVTKVTYTMAEALEKTCNFTVTLNCTTLQENAPAKEITETGKSNTKSKLLVRVMPNPSSNFFSILTTSNSIERVQLRVTDVMGRVIEQRENIAANGAITIGHQYRAGIYYIQVMQGNEKILVRCIKR
jgi:uncharacterized delta-60 repeat protein